MSYAKIFRTAFPKKQNVPLDSLIDPPITKLSPESLPNLRNAIAQENLTPDALENLNNVLVGDSGKHYSSLLQKAESYLSPLKKQGQTLLDETDNIDLEDVVGILQSGNTYNLSRLGNQIDSNHRYQTLSGRFDELTKNAYNIKKVDRLTKHFLEDDLRSIEFDIRESGKRFDNLLFDGVSQKTKFYDFRRIIANQPHKMSEIYGVTPDDFVASLYDGSATGNKFLDEVSKSWRNAQKQTLGELRGRGVPVDPANPKYYDPFYVPADVLDMMSQEDFLTLLKTHTNLDENGLERTLTDYLFLQKNPASKNALNVGKRDFQFKSGRDAVDFYSQVKGWDNTSNIISDFRFGIGRQIHTGILQSMYGSDPEGFLKSVTQSVKGLSAVERSKVKRELNNFMGKFNNFTTSYFKPDDFNVQTGRIVSSFVSLVSGAPSIATTRNAIIDFEGHAVALGKAIYSPTYRLGQAVAGTFKNFTYMTGHGFQKLFGSEKEYRSVVDGVLDAMGFANSFDTLKMSTLSNFENVGSYGDSVGTSLMGGLSKKLQDLNSNLYRISGADSLIDSRRARHVVSTQQFWKMNFKNFRNYDEWAKGQNNPRFVAQFEASTGIGRQEWEFLKRSKTLKLASEESMLFNKIPEFITKEKILQTSDDVASKFKRANESSEVFKTRVANAWQRLMYRTMQENIPVPNYVDSIANRIAPESALLNGMLRGALKFVDPAHAQFVSLRNAIARRVYGDVSQYVGFDKSLMGYGSGLMFGYLPFTVARTWLNDVMRGNKPTDFLRRDEATSTQLKNAYGYKNAMMLFSASGLGGFANMVATQGLEVYGKQGSGMLTSTPAGGTAYRLNRFVSSALRQPDGRKNFDMARSLSDLAGYPKLWYIRGLYDYTLRHLLLTPAQNRLMLRKAEENYGVSPLVR